MYDYNAIMIARAEHEQRVNSMTPVQDFDQWIPDDPPPWVSRKAGQLLCALGNGLASVGARLRNGRGVMLNTPLPEPETGKVTG